MTDINNFINDLNRRDSRVKQCDLFGAMDADDTEYLDRDSSSISEILHTTMPTAHGNAKGYVKLWFGWDKIPKNKIIETALRNPGFFGEFGLLETDINKILYYGRTSSLDYEQKMYEYITQNIVLKNLSPNFIPVLASNTCGINTIVNSLRTSRNFLQKKKLSDKLETMNILFPQIETRFIVTQAGEGPSASNFLDFIREGYVRAKEEEIYSIIFQFFYAYYLLHEFKIVHNDNHLGNAIIVDLVNPVTLDITIRDFNIKFTTRYIVKLYDWDHSYCEHVGDNVFLRDFYDVRTIPEFIRGRDFSAFICFITEYNIPAINKALRKIIDGPIPTEWSNTDDIIIDASPELRQWIENNQDRLKTQIFDKGVQSKYITIEKATLDRLISDKTAEVIRQKFGKDMYGQYVYDGAGVTNIYLTIFGSRIGISKGSPCHPLYDSTDLDVVKYFTQKKEFDRLCVGLKHDETVIVQEYNYKKSSASISSSKSDNGSKASLESIISNVASYTPSSSKMSYIIQSSYSPSGLSGSTSRKRISPKSISPKSPKRTSPKLEKECKRPCPVGKECNRKTGRCKKVA